ncbi:MAG TPA: hypothetical protein VIW67_11715 [Terriglobales bacterium]
MGSFLAGIILFLTVTSSFVLGILAAYGAVAGIIYLFARQSGQTVPTTSPTLVPEKAMRAAASGD